MNKTLKYTVAAAMLLFAGCVAVDKALYNERVEQVPVPAQTNAVPIVTPAQTNVTAIVQNGVTNYTVTIIPARTNWSVVVVPATTNFAVTLEPRGDVETIVEATKVLPWPGVSLAASLFGMAYAGYRNMRNRQLNKALALGIEKYRDLALDDQKDSELVQILAEYQDRLGVKKEAETLLAREGLAKRK